MVACTFRMGFPPKEVLKVADSDGTDSSEGSRVGMPQEKASDEAAYVVR